MDNSQKLRLLIEENDKIINTMNSNDFFNKESYIPIKETLNVINKKLSNKKYTVAIIAAMKAGKSTLFNSILGEDILPNESAACTVSITEIKHSNVNSQEVIKFYKNGTKEVIKAQNGQSIQDVFLEDIRKVREAGKVQDIEKYYLEHKIEALNNSNYEGLVDNFSLVDTPGPNEASNGDFDTSELKETAYYQLRNADAIIFVLDYLSYKSETNAKLLKDIFAGREDIAKDNEKIFFVVNKLDARSDKDRPVEDILKDIKQFIAYNTDNILPNANVIGMSGLMGLYGRGLINNTLSDVQRESCEQKYMIKYAKKEMIDGRMAFIPPTSEELGQALMEDSNLLQFEKEVIMDTFVKSSGKMIKGTKDILLNKLDFMHKDIDSNILILDKNLNQLKDDINVTKSDIVKILNDSKVVFNDIERSIAGQNQALKQSVSSISSEIRNVIDNELSQYQDLYESTDKVYLENISANINMTCKHAVESFVLRKQDEFIRKYNDYRSKLNLELYKAVNDLSKRADTIIKKNLDINMETSSMVELGLDDKMFQSNITDEEQTFGGEESSSGKSKSGAGLATAGAAVGMAVGGPIGAIIGGIAGFLLGSGSSETQEPVRRLMKYKLDTTEIKSDLKNFYIQQSQKIEKQFDSYLSKETQNVHLLINNVLENFEKQVNMYLDDLLADFESKKGERELIINNLKKLDGVVLNYKSNIENI